MTIDTLVAAAIKERSVLAALGDALSSPLVTPNPFQRELMKFAVRFGAQYRAVPRSGDWDAWLGTLPTDMRTGVAETLGRLRQIDVSGFTPEFLANEATETLQTIAARTAVANMQGQVDSITPESLRRVADQVGAIETVGLSDLLHLADVEQHARTPDLFDYTTTGINALDRYIGGFAQELTFVLADSGVGKSTMLINFGKHRALEGGNVLHVTFELSAPRTLHRYYRLITEMDKPEYLSKPDKVVAGVQHWLKFARGRVDVLYRPPYTIDVEGLRVLVDRYAEEYGGVDMVILDYLDLMALPKDYRGDTYAGLGVLSHSVRALCDEFGCDVVSATQATRNPRAGERERLRLQDMGDSYNKVRGAGLIFGLVQTEEEARMHQGRLALLKLRDSPGVGAEIPLFVYLDYMMLADLDDPNSRRIIHRMGLEPGQRREAA